MSSEQSKSEEPTTSDEATVDQQVLGPVTGTSPRSHHVVMSESATASRSHQGGTSGGSAAAGAAHSRTPSRVLSQEAAAPTCHKWAISEASDRQSTGHRRKSSTGSASRPGAARLEREADPPQTPTTTEPASSIPIRQQRPLNPTQAIPLPFEPAGGYDPSAEVRRYHHDRYNSMESVEQSGPNPEAPVFVPRFMQPLQAPSHQPVAPPPSHGPSMMYSPGPAFYSGPQYSYEPPRPQGPPYGFVLMPPGPNYHHPQPQYPLQPPRESGYDTPANQWNSGENATVTRGKSRAFGGWYSGGRLNGDGIRREGGSRRGKKDGKHGLPPTPTGWRGGPGPGRGSRGGRRGGGRGGHGMST